MKRKLEMDDVREGMHITVFRGEMDQRTIPGPHGPQERIREKSHYNGKVLEVISVDMPYIVIACHEARGTRTDALDLRKVEIMALSKPYILGLLPDFEFSVDDFWSGFDMDAVHGMDVDIEGIFKGLNTE